MRKALGLAALAIVLAAPATAHAGDVAMRVQNVPLGGRSLAAVSPAMHFNMFAAHWLGRGQVLYRTHRLHGTWTAWTAADSDGNTTGVWNDGDLDWTGASDGIQFRTSGNVSRLRTYELWSRVTSVPSRSLAAAGSPAIVTRAQWGADEDIVRAKPLVAKTLKLAIVHHTAGTNTYTRAQAAAIVRGIEVYHVEGNGWNDIGYNFLVDRFGTVYEGRAGGMTRDIIGAHAEGFNTGSVGVALIGNYATATPPAAQQDALVQLLAWRLDLAHADPLSNVAYTSGGNLKYPAGKVVTLRAISGHRDTGPSECPGNGAYALLPSIAKRVALTGLPKVFSPTVAGTIGGAIRFQARLSASLPWTVTVTNAAGHAVAGGSGTGDLVDWTWHSPAGHASYGWAISTAGALSATGTIGGGIVPPPAPPSPVPPGDQLTLTGLAVTPGVVAPAPDGSGATATFGFTLSGAAQVTAGVTSSTGAAVLTALDATAPAGANVYSLDVASLPDGRYTLAVSAKDDSGAQATASALFVVDRTMTTLLVTSSDFSPSSGGTTISFSLTQAVAVNVSVVQNGTILATLFNGQLGVGPHSLSWNGAGGAGVPFPAGSYSLVVTVTDALGQVESVLPLTIDSG